MTKTPKKKVPAIEVFVNVYQILASIDAADGVKTTLVKYKTKFTGKNYLGVMMTKEDHANGYSTGWGNSRLGEDEIMKVQRGIFSDKATHIKRNIYFLEGQKDQALKLIRVELEQAVSHTAIESAKMYYAWHHRNHVPGNKPPTQSEGVVMAKGNVTLRMMNVENQFVGVSLTESESPLNMRRVSLEIPDVKALTEMYVFIGQQIKRMSQ